MGRQGDKETRRQGDKGTRGQGDKGTRGQGRGGRVLQLTQRELFVVHSLLLCPRERPKLESQIFSVDLHIFGRDDR